jgi:hypothetical protein
METRTFNTMMVTASTTSLVQYISAAAKTTTAGMARIFEFVVKPGNGVGRIDKTAAQVMIGKSVLTTARQVGSTPSSSGRTLRRARRRAASGRYHRRHCGGNPDERFWVAAIAG